LDPSDVSSLVTLLILLILSAFFSSAETALTTVNKLRMRSLLEEEHSKRAKTVLKLIEDPTKMLSAILIFNNVVNLTASSITTTFAYNLSAKFGLTQNESLIVGLATGILTVLILIFGEITPKSLATIYADQMSLAYASIIYFITNILTPVVFIVNKISTGLLLLFRIDVTKKYHSITEYELRTFVDVSHEEGIIESEERRMITNVVDFGDSLAKDIMVPRMDMELAHIDLTYDELLGTFSKEKFTRMPVYSGTVDNIIGIINLKDLFFYNGSPEEFSIQDIIREPYFTYEYKKTAELFIEMRKDSIPMAIVLDEYGALTGLITIEDLIEEIVGEIRDEYDEDEEDLIKKIKENEYAAEGSTKLDEINEVIGLNLSSDDYDSIAGHIINLLQHLPEKGEMVEDEYAIYTVVEIDKNRIDKVHILVKPSDEAEGY